MGAEVEVARVSSSELQLLIQMIQNVDQGMRGGFEQIDRKLEGMIPRPEFDSYKEAVSHRFDAAAAETNRRLGIVETAVSETAREHDGIEDQIKSVDEALDQYKTDQSAKELSALKEKQSQQAKNRVAIGLSVFAALFSGVVALLTNVVQG